MHLNCEIGYFLVKTFKNRELKVFSVKKHMDFNIEIFIRHPFSKILIFLLVKLARVTYKSHLHLCSIKKSFEIFDLFKQI